MKKVQLILLSLLCNFVYGQDSSFYDFNYTKVDSKQLVDYYQTIHYKDKNNVIQKTYFISGNTESEIYISNDKEKFKNGLEIKWYENGRIKRYINYINDTIDGSLNTFWENGNPKRQDIYKMGKLVEGKCFDFEGNEINYYNYEILPEFIGGTKALYSYIKKEIHYPEEALENKHTGRVTVSFVVSETGKIREEKIFNGGEECLNIEALRIVENMPKWNPGQVDGEYVSMRIGIPILFLIAD